jgi:hypothetical protein
MITEPIEPTPFYFQELEKGKELLLKNQKYAHKFSYYNYNDETINGIKMEQTALIGKIFDKTKSTQIIDLFKDLKEVKEIAFTEKGTIAFFNETDEVDTQIQSNLIKLSEIKNAKLIKCSIQKPIYFKLKNDEEYLVAPIILESGGTNYFKIEKLKLTDNPPKPKEESKKKVFTAKQLSQQKAFGERMKKLKQERLAKQHLHQHRQRKNTPQ